MPNPTIPAACGAMPASGPLSPADARRFLHTCNDEIEAGMTPDLARRLREAREIVEADLARPAVRAIAGGRPLTMEKQPSRRAALALFGAAPALAILPTARLKAPFAREKARLSQQLLPQQAVHPDAELLAMAPAIDAADKGLQAAFDARNPAEDAYLAKAPACPARPEGAMLFSAEEQQALDAFASRMRTHEPSPAWTAYEQAFQDYERAVERVKADCGLTAASEMQDAAQETVSQLQADLVDTPAKTLAGMIFKARYAATHYYDEYDTEVALSIVDDLLAMADELAEA